jgi:hypothetical protein
MGGYVDLINYHNGSKSTDTRTWSEWFLGPNDATQADPLAVQQRRWALLCNRKPIHVMI